VPREGLDYFKAGTVPVLHWRKNINEISNPKQFPLRRRIGWEAKDCSLEQLHAQFLCSAQEWRGIDQAG
jgi:hypothetical protein